MSRPLIVTGLAIALLTGCANAPRRGEVVMKASQTEAHVALNAADVAVGDKVRIYRDVRITQRPPVSEKRLIGEGVVIRLMGDKYAALEVPASVHFQEGDYAEPD